MDRDGFVRNQITVEINVIPLPPEGFVRNQKSSEKKVILLFPERFRQKPDIGRNKTSP
jgi:hypothetical protein